MGVLAGAYVLNLISSGLVANLLVLANFRVYGGEYWRLLTYGFSTYGLLHLLMSGLVLWIAGRTLEAVLGRWRFLALFVLSGLGGATGLFVFGPPELVAVGASAAVVGLLAANGIVKLRAGEDIRGDIGLLVLLLLYSFVMGFGGYLWIGQLGGMAVGALTGYVLAFAPRDRRTTVQALGLAGVAVLCAAAVVLRVSLGVG
nr:rhomboid family intramembrane serine protease [Microlunatus panaciterrae]